MWYEILWNVVSLTRLHAGCILELRLDTQWFHRDVTRQANDCTGRGAMRTRTGVIQTGSATAGIRAGKYTPDGTTNLRKILNKRCAQQSVYKTVLNSLRIVLRL